MKAERDCFEPAMRSMAARTSPESVIEVFSFILLLYYHVNKNGDSLWKWRRGGRLVFAFSPPILPQRTRKGWGTPLFCAIQISVMNRWATPPERSGTAQKKLAVITATTRSSYSCPSQLHFL